MEIEPPKGSPVMYQRWQDLLFLHWEVGEEILRPRIPSGLELDTFEGKAYLGIVPFFMKKIRPRFLPAVPGLSWFLELNVRTYVRDVNGRPGVWFFSLDCDQALAVWLARTFFNLPYEQAIMSAYKEDDTISYECRRKNQTKTSKWKYGPNGPSGIAVAGSLEYFLLERYLLFSQNRKGTLFSGQVCHSPYNFSKARVDCFDALPAEWDGFTLKSEPCSALYSVGPEVEIHPLKQLLRIGTEKER